MEWIRSITFIGEYSMATHTYRQLACMVNYYIKGLVKEGYRIDSKTKNHTKLVAPTYDGHIEIDVTVHDLPDKYQMISTTVVPHSSYPIKTHRLTAYHAYNDLYADSIEEAKSVCNRR